ncbi:hypothetical protein CDAR_286391 [Caerostris darwini]|uniref:Uncharacterized protein n=1 Tax=Caerostris darwini TaxID=1538125 RepID=A0AAV4W3C8_9ARAC|nr:hypothetical protein CDAR_286391 [Caerostris darwini]
MRTGAGTGVGAERATSNEEASTGLSSPAVDQRSKGSPIRPDRWDTLDNYSSPTTREREKLISSCCLFREIDCNRKNHIALTLMTLVTEGLGPAMASFDYYKADTLWKQVSGEVSNDGRAI